MSKNCTFIPCKTRKLFLISAIFLLFTSQAVGKQSFLWTQHQYLNVKPLSTYTKDIPLNVKYFVDKNMNMPVEFLSSQNWIPTSQHFYPGISDDILWLDINFTVPVEAEYEELYLDFGSMPIDMAELYFEQGEDRWILAGRTGHSIPKSAMTNPTWKQVIPILSHIIKSEGGIYHARAKIVCSKPIPIILNLTPKRIYDFNAVWINMFTFIIFIAFWFLFMNFLFFGIVHNNKVYLDLGLMTFFLMLYQLTTKGIGPVFLWNFAVPYIGTTKISYIFGEASLLFAGLASHRMIESHDMKTSRIMKTLPVFMLVVGSNLLITIISSSNKLANVYFVAAQGTGILLLLIILLYSTISERKENKHHAVFLYITYSIDILLLLFKITALILKATVNMSIFSIFDNDFYLTSDIFYLICIVPFAFLSNNARKQKELTIANECRQMRDENARFREALKVDSEIHFKLYHASNVLYNTYHLPASTDSYENTERRNLMEKNLVKLMDYINAACIINNTVEHQKSLLLFKNEFENSIRFLKTFPEMKDVEFTIKNKISDDIIIRENEQLLQLTMLFFITSCMQITPKEKKVKITADYNAGQLEISVHNASVKMNQKDIFISESESTKASFLNLQNKLVSMYNGKLSSEVYSTGTKFCMTLNIPQQTPGENYTVSERQIKVEELPERKRKSEDAKLIDQLLLINGRAPRLFYIDNNIDNHNLIGNYLETKAQVMFLTSVADAWNLMNSANSVIPDIIICEYAIPGITGLELMRKCNDTPALAHIPFIFILSLSDEGKRQELMLRGASSCISKPFNPEYLLSTLYAIITLLNKSHKVMMSQLNNVVRSVEHHTTVGSGISQFPPVQGTSYSDSPQQENVWGSERIAPPPREEPCRKEETKAIVQSGSQAEIFSRYGLSSREQQIALLIASGMSDKQIAENLSISPATVATHNKKVFKKLEVHSRIELMNKLR